MKRSTLVLTTVLLWLLFTVCAYAADSARVVKYSQTDIIPIRAKVRFTTLIVLPANEEILDFTVGDKDFWIVNGIHNLCYLHPAQTGIRSNMNLVTASGRVYSFLLSEISNQPDFDPDLKVFIEPKEESTIGGVRGHVEFVRASEVEAYRQEAVEVRAQAAKEVQEAQTRVQQQLDQYRKEYPGKLRFDYTYKLKAGKEPFRISAIYHDDKFTYIQCAAQEKPTIYEINEGKPDLVNFDFENGVYVIPKIVNHGYLAVGKQKVTQAILIDLLCTVGKEGKLTTQKAQQIVEAAHDNKFTEALEILRVAHAQASKLRLQAPTQTESQRKGEGRE